MWVNNGTDCVIKGFEYPGLLEKLYKCSLFTFADWNDELKARPK